MSMQAAEKITAECEQRTSEIGTLFDQLLFLTQVQKWLGAKHRQLFHQWLSCPLEEQYAMLAPRYHDAAQGGALPSDAFALSAFTKLIPAGGVEEGPRVLFYSNLDIILDMLKEELAVSGQTSAALTSASPLGAGKTTPAPWELAEV